MLRLTFAVILFLFSLLAVFRALEKFLWIVSVAMNNYPYVFMMLAIISFLVGLKAGSFKQAILLFNAAAFLLYSAPITCIYWRGRNLDNEMAQVFPSSDLKSELQQPFSFIKMFSGIAIENVKFRSITYKTLPHKILTFDFYPSNLSQRSPTVIIIHGGSWESGDSKQLPDLNSYLANRGYNVTAINYRLAPAYKSPAAVEDVRDLIAYLTQHSGELNIDTSGYVLLGRSAGAQIAMVAAYSLHNKNIKGVISYYGPADMVWGAQVKVIAPVLNTDKIYKDYFGGNYAEVPEKFKEASACEYVNASSTPTLLIHGSTDALVSYQHSVRLHEKLNAAHVKNYFLDLPFATHAFDYNINSPYGQIATYAVERFLNSVTK